MASWVQNRGETRSDSGITMLSKIEKQISAATDETIEHKGKKGGGRAFAVNYPIAVTRLTREGVPSFLEQPRLVGEEGRRLPPTGGEEHPRPASQGPETVCGAPVHGWATLPPSRCVGPETAVGGTPCRDRCNEPEVNKDRRAFEVKENGRSLCFRGEPTVLGCLAQAAEPRRDRHRIYRRDAQCQYWDKRWLVLFANFQLHPPPLPLPSSSGQNRQGLLSSCKVVSVGLPGSPREIALDLLTIWERWKINRSCSPP